MVDATKTTVNFTIFVRIGIDDIVLLKHNKSTTSYIKEEKICMNLTMRYYNAF